MAYLRKPPNSTDDDLRHVAAILSMIATAITRMADTAPGTSKNEGQNKKTMGHPLRHLMVFRNTRS
jgi:hypothetical protein